MFIGCYVHSSAISRPFPLTKGGCLSAARDNPGGLLQKLQGRSDDKKYFLYIYIYIIYIYIYVKIYQHIIRNVQLTKSYNPLTDYTQQIGDVCSHVGMAKSLATEVPPYERLQMWISHNKKNREIEFPRETIRNPCFCSHFFSISLPGTQCLAEPGPKDDLNSRAFLGGCM